jgi:hypothetical protein
MASVWAGVVLYRSKPHHPRVNTCVPRRAANNHSHVQYVRIAPYSGCARAISSRMFGVPLGFEQRTGTDATMRRVIAFAVCGVLVSGCSASWMPTMEMPALPTFKPTPAVDNVRIESDPPGADARTAAGASCKTPCTLGVPLSDGNITVSLNGYVPQTVPVQLVGNGGAPRGDDFSSSGYPHVSPNPVSVQLELSPPPPIPDKPVKKKPAVAAKKKPPALTQSATSTQSTQSTIAPSPQNAPWPTR